MSDIRKQVDKALRDLETEVHRVVRKETAQVARDLLFKLQQEVSNIFGARDGKSPDQLSAEVVDAGERSGVPLNEVQVQEIVNTMLNGECPELVADIHISGLD